jgi:hypothetical protein
VAVADVRGLYGTRQVSHCTAIAVAVTATTAVRLLAVQDNTTHPLHVSLPSPWSILKLSKNLISLSVVLIDFVSFPAQALSSIEKFTK